MKTELYKIGRFGDDEAASRADDIPHRYRDTFALEDTKGEPRVRIGSAQNPVSVFRALCALFAEPLFVLIVLHTSRCSNPLGRYQSPPLRHFGLTRLLSEFCNFLTADARLDIWTHFPKENVTLVLDRHNVLNAYGPIKQFEEVLRGLGFREGTVDIPIPHCHHYHEEFDLSESQILRWFDWKRTDLRPEDCQR